jgi:phosphoribosylformylglycinamidine cyclo-ligase
LTPIPGGRTFGEALLDASFIYVRFVAACQKAGLKLHYAAHVTGHGWRKLMRLDEPFVYRITQVREPSPIFRFLMEAGPLDAREAYATFNMGAGFAVYVDARDAERCIALARGCGHDAWLAGAIHKEGARKAVDIAPLRLIFESDSLNLRQN